MKKYQEALDNLYRRSAETHFYIPMGEDKLWKNTLQNLVDKETPKKVIHKHKEYVFPSAYRLSGKCPNCKNHVDENKYCNICGQKLDWSDTNV